MAVAYYCVQELRNKFLNLDQAISRQLYALRPRSEAVNKFVKNVTRVYGLIPFSIIAFIASRDLLPAGVIFVAIGIINSVIVEKMLKSLFHRARPSWSPHTAGFSFPSTHAAADTMTLVYVLMRVSAIQSSPSWILVVGIIYALTLASRLVYGHHYVSDVLAGIIVGVILSLPLLAFV